MPRFLPLTRIPALLIALLAVVLSLLVVTQGSYAQSDPSSGSTGSGDTGSGSTNSGDTDTGNADTGDTDAGNNAASSAAAASLPARLVFAHDLPNACPFYDTGGYYGSNQPLLISGTGSASLSSVYGQVKAAGLDGIAVDLFTDFSGMAERLTYGDLGKFVVAPVVDTSLEPAGKSTAQIISDVVAAATSYASLAAGHTSAQRYNGKYVVWTYNDSNHLAPADWATVKTLLAAANIPISFFGDVGGQYIHNDDFADSINIFTGLLTTFDQAYTFGPEDSASDAATTLSGFAQGGKPFAWTLRPEYLKVSGNASTGNTIGYEDAQGTLTLQNRWQDVETKSLLLDPLLCRTAFVSTWSDFSESSGIMPSTDMNYTLSEINAYCASQFKQQTSPFSDARQYLTVQQSGYLGGSVLLECTVINPTAFRDYVYPVVQNLNGTCLAGQFGGVCTPYSITRFSTSLPVTSALLAQTQINGVSVLKVYSILKDDLSGNALVKTNSPRTMLFSSPAPAGGGQALYYSFSSRHTTGYQPSGTLNISPGGVKTLSITPAGNGYVPRSLELLHDTRRAYISYGTSPVSGVVFTDLNRQADNRNDPTDHGCYIIREVTADGKETYSDPLNVTNN